MPLDNRDKAYLWDMLDAAAAIQEFVAGASFEEYLSNRMMRGAGSLLRGLCWSSNFSLLTASKVHKLKFELQRARG